MSEQPFGERRRRLTFKQGLVLVVLFLAFAAIVAFVNYQPNFSVRPGRYSPWRIEPERPRSP
jgi:hypothetical protein